MKKPSVSLARIKNDARVLRRDNPKLSQSEALKLASQKRGRDHYHDAREAAKHQAPGTSLSPDIHLKHVHFFFRGDNPDIAVHASMIPDNLKNYTELELWGCDTAGNCIIGWGGMEVVSVTDLRQKAARMVADGLAVPAYLPGAINNWGELEEATNPTAKEYATPWVRLPDDLCDYAMTEVYMGKNAREIYVGYRAEDIPHLKEFAVLTFPLKRKVWLDTLRNALEAAKQYHHDTFGCPDCRLPGQDGYYAVNPDCKTCGGKGRGGYYR